MKTYFQHREASNLDYDATPDIFKKYMDMVNAKIGTETTDRKSVV